MFSDMRVGTRIALSTTTLCVAGLHILFLWWTISVLKYVHVYVLASTTGVWYFHSVAKPHKQPTWDAVQRACSFFFGSLCFASLVTSIVRCISFAIRLCRKVVPDRFCVLLPINFCLSALARLTDLANKYVVAYMALNGGDYCSSVRGVASLLHRNALASVSVDLFARAIIYGSVFVVSVMAALGSFWFASQSLLAAQGWLAAFVAYQLSYAIMSVFAQVLIAVYVLYFLSGFVNFLLIFC